MLAYILGILYSLVSADLAKDWLKVLQRKLGASRKARREELAQIEITFTDPRRLARLYVEPDCQQYNSVEDLSVSEAPSQPVQQPIFSWLERALRTEHSTRDGRNTILVLSDAGLGKTSLLIMIKLTHLFRFWPDSLDFKLFKLDKDILTNIKRIKDQGRTVLLLDALDEDSDARKGFDRYLVNLLKATEPFRQVIITCRTQFLPEASETEAREKGKLKTGGYSCNVIHLSPFDDEKIEAYLKKEYPSPWIDRLPASGRALSGQHRKREKARQILASMDTLRNRPMLLSHIRDLVEKNFASEDEYLVYSVLVEAWLTREERRPSDLMSPQLLDHCERIALYLQSEGKNALSRDQINEIFKGDHFARAIEHFDLSGRYLLARTAKSEFKFSHASLQEFLVAHALITSGTKKIPQKGIKATSQLESFLCSWIKADARERLSKIPWQVFSDPDVKSIVVRLLIRPGLDLRGMDLRGISLKKAKIREIDLRGADLNAADLENADLEKVKFSGANLRQARFVGTFLRDVELDHVDARDADFKGAKLQDVDFSFGSFVRADFNGTSMGGVTEGAGFLASLGAEGVPLSGAAGPPQPRVLRFLPQYGHAAQINALTWHPSSRLMASGSVDGTIRLWDMAERRVSLVLADHLGVVRCLAWHSDGCHLASGSEDGTVRLWDAWRGTLLETVTAKASPVLGLSWDSDERLTAVVQDGYICMWRFEGHLSQVPENTLLGALTAVAWKPGSTRFAGGTHAGNILLWPIERSAPPRIVGSSITTMSWNPVEDSFATGSMDGGIKVWEVGGNGKISLQTQLKSASPLLALSWSPKGRFLLSASTDGAVILWDVVDQDLLRKLGEQYGGSAMTWDRDERVAVLGSVDGSIRLWEDDDDFKTSVEIKPYSFKAASISWSPNRRWIAVRFDHGAMHMINLGQGGLVECVMNDSARSIAWSAGGDQLAVGCDTGSVMILEAGSWRLMKTIEMGGGRISTVAWSPSGLLLVAGSEDGSVSLWNQENGESTVILSQSEDPVSGIEWDLQGKHLIISSAQVIRFRDLEKRVFIASNPRKPDRPDSVKGLSRSPQGNMLAKVYVGGKVEIEHRDSGRVTATLEIPGKLIESVAWSPSSTQLALLCRDGTVHLWEPTSGRLSSFPIGGCGLDWNSQGTRLVIGSLDGSSAIWDVSAEDPLAILRIYCCAPLAGLFVTADGYVDGPQEALGHARFVDGWAVYDLTDLPERCDPERLLRSLREALGPSE